MRETSKRRANVRQHQLTLASSGVLPRFATSHVPLLPRTLSLLQQPLLSRSHRSTVRLRPMPPASRSAETPHFDVPSDMQHHHGPLSIVSAHAGARDARSRGNIPASLSDDRYWECRRVQVFLGCGLTRFQLVGAERRPAPTSKSL